MGCCLNQGMDHRTMTDAIKSAACWVNFIARRTVLFAQVIAVSLVLVLVAMALETRDSPLTVLPHSPVAVHAGQWAEIRLPVRRDLTRRCAVEYHRMLIDSDGSRFDLPGGAEVPDGIRRNEAKTPGIMPLMVLVPPLKTGGQPGIDPGPATLKVTRAWACNQIQELFPIREESITPLYVLP